MSCLVCTGELGAFASGQVLGDQQVTYVRCSRCGLITATDPNWLDRAYSSAIASLDVGLLSRCITLSHITAAVIRSERLHHGRFLDWAGGYGTLTRLMRDRGFHFLHSDPMASNLFAQGYEGGLQDVDYDLTTAVEVLEHLPDPVEALTPVARCSDMLLATTEVLPQPPPMPDDWWYYAPETGQHITFYTPDSLRHLSSRLGYPSVVVGPFVHLFHKRPISARTARLVRSPKLAYLAGAATSLFDRRHSLTEADAKDKRATRD